MKRLHPLVYEARQHDKLRYRYPGPGGESYLDLIERLRQLIIELERKQCDVLIVAHTAVLRVILGYFTEVELEKIPYLEIDPDAAIELSPTAYSANVTVCSIAGVLGAAGEAEAAADLAAADERAAADLARGAGAAASGSSSGSAQ